MALPYPRPPSSLGLTSLSPPGLWRSGLYPWVLLRSHGSARLQVGCGAVATRTREGSYPDLGSNPDSDVCLPAEWFHCSVPQFLICKVRTVVVATVWCCGRSWHREGLRTLPGTQQLPSKHECYAGEHPRGFEKQYCVSLWFTFLLCKMGIMSLSSQCCL